MIYVIAKSLVEAKDQMCSYGYTSSEWKYVDHVCVLLHAFGGECFVLDGASERRGNTQTSYRAIIRVARTRNMIMHYKPELHLGKPQNKTEDKRNDLYCSW